MAAEIKFQITNSSTQTVQFAAGNFQGFATTPTMSGQVMGGQTVPVPGQAPPGSFEITLSPGIFMRGGFDLTLSAPPYASSVLNISVEASLTDDPTIPGQYQYQVKAAATGFEAYGGPLSASIGLSPQQQEIGQLVNLPHDGPVGLATIQIISPS